MTDFRSLLRYYEVPFNDPCDPDYTGVCQCEFTPYIEETVALGPLTICSVDYPAGTPLTTILAALCGGGSDDDWRFSTAGISVADPAYRTGNTSVGTDEDTHQFRVDGLFQFNPLATFLFEFLDNKFTFESTTGGIVALSNSTTTMLARDILGQVVFDGRLAGNRTSRAAILGRHIGPSAMETTSALEFYVNLAGEAFTRNVMTLQEDARLRLNQYSSFDDGPPTILAGFISDDVVSRHPIAGDPDPNSVVAVNAAGTGLEYQNPAAAGVSPRNGLSFDGSDLVLGGTLDMATTITNVAQVFTLGTTSGTQYGYFRNTGAAAAFNIFSRNTTTNQEGELNVSPAFVSLVHNFTADDAVSNGETSVSLDDLYAAITCLNNPASPTIIRVGPVTVELKGLPEYASEGAAIADANLPSDGLYKVTGDNNLKIK